MQLLQETEKFKLKKKKLFPCFVFFLLIISIMQPVSTCVYLCMLAVNYALMLV